MPDIDLLSSFILFFAVIDPVGTVPVFIAATRAYSASERKKIALQASLVAACVLLFFVVVGELILNSIGIDLVSFQIAGGIVLFLFALTMIFGDSKPEQEIKQLKKHIEVAIFPLAMPSIASPGAMLAAVLLTENAQYSLVQQAWITATMLAVLLVVLVLMLLANPLKNLIGDSGASVVSRVMGLILASVAVDNILKGLALFFNL